MNFDDKWSSEEIPQEELPASTLAEMEALAKKIQEQRVICDKAAEVKKVEDNTLFALEKRMLVSLEAAGKSNYDAEVGKFFVSDRVSVRVPQGLERMAFFEHLKEIGQFDALITVNSATLTAWYKAERDRAAEEGRLLDFQIPGIDQVTVNQTLSFRKKAK